MKIKLKEVVASSPAFNTIMNQTMTAKIAFKLSKVFKKVQDELKTFEETREKLFEKYCEMEDGQLVTETIGEGEDAIKKYIFKSDKDEKAFEDEHKELMETEVSIKVQKITLSDIKQTKPSPAMLAALSWLVTE